MTSLAHQLKRLALPQNDASLLTRTEVASLLFEPKDAATIDRSTFYALGCTGLEELLGIETAFLEFQDTLFSSAAQTMERSVQSKEVNKKLDASISLFLTRLCPYFLLKPAHKCLEWLIHRFHIHLYNVDSLLACILPYHDTNFFVRVLQLLNIQDVTNKWNWLHCLQKPGVPLSRGALITHCYSDLGFMDFICSLVTNSIEAYSKQTGSCSQLRIIFSFYASTIVSALDAVDRVSDSIISKLLPYIQKGMKSPLQDYKAATYMIVCQLAVKVVMEATLVDKLAVHISKSLLKEPLLVKEGVACLVVLLQNQQQTAVEPRALDHLSTMPALVPTLQEISAYDVSPLLRHLLPHLVHTGFSSEKTDSLAVLKSLLEALPLGGGLDQTVARLLLDDYLSQTELPDEQMAALNQRLLPVVRVLESRYCGSLDSVLERHVTDISSKERKRLFHQFLSLSVSSGKFQFMDNSDTSLLLSLKHTQPTIRVSAMEHLMGVITSGERQSLDQNFLRDSVLERLQDEVPEVVATSLKVLEVLVDDLDPEDVMSSLLTLLHRPEASLSESWLPVLTEAVRLLSGSWLGTEKRLETVGWRLLPLLVVSSSSSSQLSLASCVGHSTIMAQQPLTQNWSKELDELMKYKTKSDFVTLANERLIATLSRNLADMEQGGRRDALEKLTLVVEGLQCSSVATRAAFLVLTRALLLSLGDLDQEGHLGTSLRVYGLLEPRLLEVVRNDGEPQGDVEIFMASSFSGGLTSYLSGGDTGYSSVLLCLLKDFISSLKCHNASFKDDAWWSPEKLDVSACRYLSLLCRLFSIVVRGAGEGPAASICRELTKLLIRIHLPEPLRLFRFLCVLWGYNSDQLDIKVGAVLKTQALYVGGALLSIQSSATLEKLAAADSPVFPTLLCCLCSPVREVRRAALGVLKSLSSASASPFQPITEKLLRTSEEIMADPAYLSQALGALHDSCLGAGKKKSQQEALSTAVQQLLQSLLNPSCPSYSAVVLLEALSQVNGESVLSALLPLLDRLLDRSGPDRPSLLWTEARLVNLLLGKYNEASAPLLAKDQKCLDLFIRVLGSSTLPVPDGPSYQICALEQMTKSFFLALGDEPVQQKLLSVMFDLLTDNRSPLVANSVGSAFKAIAVDGQLVANELAPPEKPSVGMTVLQTRRSRMSQRKPQEEGEAAPEGGAVSWRRVTLILELLQKKKKLKRPHTLVPVLFSLLARTLETNSADLNIEYTKQLLLSCLLNVCHKVSPEGGASAADVLDEDKFSVELVVQCIRTSDMPQTHHHGLLLLGAAAAIFPEKVLHNIMPIFTFMGANVMRLDDAYSFQVIDKTVQMVVPALIQAQQLAGDSSSPHVDIVVTKIMHVFADALPHVPAHRREPVLTQLVTLLGPAHYLWVLMALLFKLHATQAASSVSDKEAALQADMDFWISVSCHFEVNEQLTSLVSILNFLLQLPDDKDDNTGRSRGVTRQGSRKTKEAEEKVEEVIFSVESHSGKELRHFKFICVSFMAQLLASNSFIGKVVDADDDGSSESLEQLQQKLLQDILRYIHSVARCVEENASKPTAKFWRVLLNKAYDVLDKVNSLLPADTFITVVKGLMGNELPSVRRKAMELLNNKLQHRTQWTVEQENKIMQLTDVLLRIACRSPSTVAGEEEEEAEQAINRQTALYSLKLLSRSFGAGHQEALLPVLKQTAALVVTPQEEKNVTGSALLCIAETVSVLKALAIPQLPRLMPAVLQTLTDRKDLRSSDIYLLSAVTALQRVIETLPHFISPYLQDVILQVCRLTQLVESSTPSTPSSSTSSTTSSPTAQLCTRLTSLSSTLSTKLPPRVLLPTITKCYNSMVADRKAQLGALMIILREHIARMEKEELNAQQSELTTFFLTALDFRAQHCQGNLDETAAVEGSVIDCLLAMVMKLSEVTFRPLFFKLFDWTKSGNTERLLTFYRLTDSVAGRLKGLFVLFAGNLVKPFTDLLRQTNTSKSGDVLFESSDGEQKVALLLQYILDCMQKIFLYDTQRFLSKERADALAEPLLDQLENMVGGLQQYQQRVTQHLVPCVGQFIVALNDDSQWKNVNYQILLRSRHAHSQVRFSSLLLLLEVASKLKENYMVLLPETIPFLAELMEDECEEVEQQVQKVVQEMENILGEPLQSYF